ncbi:hypothetical protein BGZ96_008988 [Linnemannia gamsii]|uniref:Uncharacterized protein n=1 Tax=Linnemannia gamsii TaxID=64522 RepID=A0ABQ7JZ68_9FUNG|nr:hypothetical protein BGZ96_008988 [Linnemannia gamsii]
MFKPAASVVAKKHSKSISHDGRIPLPTDIGGDGLIRSTSTDGCGFAAAATASACPCSEQELEEQHQQAAAYHQHVAATQDFATLGAHSLPRDSLSHSLLTHQLQGQQSRQSPDGSVSSSSNLSINGTFAGLALHGNDHSASNSPIASMPMAGHRQSNLCYDYGSSSDCESDQCNPPTQVFYLNAGYAMSNASDDLGERDLKTIHTHQPTPNFSSQGTLANTRNTMDQAPASKGSCCGSKNAASNTADGSVNGGARALNLGHALTLIGASHQNGSATMNDEMRQALQQGFGAMDRATLDSVKMQHPTLLGSNGVLICGCGCGRPTVDCADCFRDMCEFVGESQAKMMKDELEYEMSMNREGGYLADLGLNMNMSSGMNLSHSTSMELDEEIEQFDRQENQVQQQQQLAQRKLTEHEEAIRLQLLEQEQMELSKLRPATINQLQLDFLDDEDWSFVDEIRTDHLDTFSIPRPPPSST